MLFLYQSYCLTFINRLTMKENQIQVFQYNGSPVTFNNGDNVMVNATEMAKPFGKRPADWLKTQTTKEFLDALNGVKKIVPSDLVQVVNGDNGGTWMHEDVAMEFARWLSPKFAIWCNTGRAVCRRQPSPEDQHNNNSVRQFSRPRILRL